MPSPLDANGDISQLELDLIMKDYKEEPKIRSMQKCQN
jgi:hypothetical protein